MTVVNLINRRLPNKPTQQNRNGILINAFRFNDDKLDCAIGGNINAYQYTYPDTPKVYRFIHSKPNLEFKIQNRNKIDEELDGTPIWGSVEWVNPEIKWRPMDLKKSQKIFPNNNEIQKEWLNVVYLGEVYWIPPNTEFKVDPITNFIIGRKLQIDEEGDVIFESVNWYVMDYNPPRSNVVLESENE